MCSQQLYIADLITGQPRLHLKAMHMLHHTFVLLETALSLLVMRITGSGPRCKVIPGSYIAILKDSGDVNEAANDVVRGKGIITQRFQNGLKGLAFDAPPGNAQAQEQLLQRVRSRADVEFVTEDCEVKAIGAAGEYRTRGCPLWPLGGSATMRIATRTDRIPDAKVHRLLPLHNNGHRYESKPRNMGMSPNPNPNPETQKQAPETIVAAAVTEDTDSPDHGATRWNGYHGEPPCSEPRCTMHACPS
jgi:hypothetical protein